LTLGYWFYQNQAEAQRLSLIDTVVSQASNNFLCDDLFILFKIRKVYNPQTQIVSGMEITGRLNGSEGRFFWKTFPPDEKERRNFLILVKDQNIVVAKAYAPEKKEVWEMRDKRDAELIAIGDLNYNEFRFIASLSRDNCEHIEETPNHYILKYRLPDTSEERDSEEKPHRIICYVEKETYLPSSIEFYNTQRKYKDFSVLAREKHGDRWIIKQASVKNHITREETTYEMEKVIFNQGIDDSVFSEEALYKP